MSASAGVPEAATENLWNNIKTGLLETTEEVCGTTRPHLWGCKTWWCNEHVREVIAAKWQAFKAWKTGKGTKASYHALDVQCTMLVKSPTRRSTRILTLTLQMYTPLQTSLEERMQTL